MAEISLTELDQALSFTQKLQV